MTENAVFRPLLRGTVRISMRYPWLFAFGFFTSFIGVGGFWEFVVNTKNAKTSAAYILHLAQSVTSGDTVLSFFVNLGRGMREAPGAIAGIVGLLLLLLCVVAGVIWCSLVSQSALIDATFKTTHNLKTTLRAEWAVGRRFALRLFGVTVTIKVILLVLFVLVGTILQGIAGQRGLVVLFALLLFCALLAVSLMTTLLTTYAGIYVVLRGFGVREALRAALRFALRHWLISIELALLFFILSFVIGFLALLIILFLTIPFVFFLLVASMVSIPTALGPLFALWFFIASLVLGAATALFTTWQTTAWTLLFIRLTTKGAVPKLVRLAKRLR